LDPGATPFGDGNWRVGTDIGPGTYRADGGTNCYWAFLRGFPGDIENIIANDYGTSNLMLTILPTYVSSETHDCGLWVPVQ
jgi:hypothetical protein